MQTYHVDYVNGKVILPEILEHISKISWVKEPETSNENDKKLSQYIFWLYLMADNYPRIRIHCTLSFSEWMFSVPSSSQDLPGSVPPSHFLRLYAACIYPHQDKLLGNLEKTRPEILLSFFYSRSIFFKHSNCPKHLTSFLFSSSSLDTGEGLLVIHEAIWRNDPGLREHYDLEHSRLDRLAFVFIIARTVPTAFPDHYPSKTICDTWDSPSSYDTGEGFTLLHEAIWRQNPNLHDYFPANHEAWARRAFQQWLTEHFHFDSQQQSTTLTSEAEETKDTPLIQCTQLEEKPPYHDYKPSEASQAPGVTISGWANGLLGIGEDCRTLAECFRSAGVTHEVCCISQILPHGSAPYDYPDRVVTHPSFAINVICLAAQDIYRLYLNTPPDWWSGRYNIGLCPWELPAWPKAATFAVNMLDEVWAPSMFIAKAFANCGKPVTYMPHAVTPPTPNGDLRSELGISPETIVFLTAYDSNASYARKNPIATIRAFNQAFAGKKINAKLIIKTMNASKHAAAWQELHNENKCGDKVLFIDEAYPIERHSRLLNTCDAFVSLHRSEGFGRLLAEALALGKLLIASNFGGNTDFTTPETACPISGLLAPVEHGLYIFSEGQSWFDADVEHAASVMYDFANSQGSYTKRIAAGQRLIHEKHSSKAVGEQILQTLMRKGIWP